VRSSAHAHARSAGTHRRCGGRCQVLGDDLQKHCTVDDEVWAQLAAHHSDEAILELLMLAGTYQTVSYFVDGLRLPLEPGARRFPA